MKNSVKVSFCGIVAALATATMAASLIPNATFAAPAIAGLFMIVAFAEAGALPALAAYIASAILSFFIADKSSWVLYLALFGYYPVLKPALEKIKNGFLKWFLKLLIFNAAALACYLTEIFVLGITVEPVLLLAAVWVTGNIAFVLYDIAVSRVAALYYVRLHKTVSSILNR
ncbi:MAG: hypothetical protein IKZ47_01775 [Clostridia bacterium]|nr:hypothetical protein [Clostridia bacterium]